MTDETRATAWSNSDLDDAKRAALQYCLCDDCGTLQWCFTEPDESDEDEETGEITYEPGECVCEDCWYEGFL